MATIDLWAKEGYLSIPDGNSIYFWGFSKGENEPVQLPGPHIIVTEGETVIVNLTNTLSEPVSISFPGQTGVMVGGQPVHPQYSGDQLLSFVNYAAPGGGTVSYTFTAAHPGTFIYESGTNPHKQVPMGLYGGLVVRPSDYDQIANKTAYGAGTDTEFDREYLIITGEIDANLHQAVKEGKPYLVSNYLPRYWTMNGRCAPDTMTMEHVDTLPHQPYSSMIFAEPGEKVLIRYIGAGIDNHPLHPHGNHTRVIALDGRLLRNGAEDRSYERFTVVVSPGQTYDQIYKWDGLGYAPNNPIPTILPNLRNMGIGDIGGTMWSGSPYLGEKGDIPQSVVSFNESGEYQFMLHSHSEPKITNWGEFPGGLITMIAIYPSLSQNVGKLE
ncbi:multicopper oxidase domain-containing protein [Tepidibacillus decaturensis]|uniref:Copper oxidase n=1 Tax=Tepidibacillus decaturensis TaxID=1413211 RepID=A0A135L3F0_9BACI|nr:multicopper oxidase domain-containing protein [Tepidibacillus decaturensis]KXG43568.1 copper oxidase [Tepidibacillus decaturensis]